MEAGNGDGPLQVFADLQENRGCKVWTHCWQFQGICALSGRLQMHEAYFGHKEVKCTKHIFTANSLEASVGSVAACRGCTNLISTIPTEAVMNFSAAM